MDMQGAPEIGILMLDGKMADVPGCMACKATFGYPVRRYVVPGAVAPRTPEDAREMVSDYVSAAGELERQGVSVITANCGLMALLQPQVAAAVRVPVVLSSLVAVPTVARMIGPERRVGILTFYADAVREENFTACGWSTSEFPVTVAGMSNTSRGGSSWTPRRPASRCTRSCGTTCSARSWSCSSASRTSAPWSVSARCCRLRSRIPPARVGADLRHPDGAGLGLERLPARRHRPKGGRPCLLRRPGPACSDLAPKIHYGPGAAGLAGEVMRELGVSHALVVTDRGVLDAGVCAPVLRALERHGITATVVSEVATNPSERHVEATVGRYRGEGCDGIIAVGGGSSMDVAKCTAALAAGGGDIREYEDGARSVDGPWPPLVLVPTTAGSGSEVVGGAIIMDSGRIFKMHVVAVPAHAALCDPTLTLSLPPTVTAACGIDALAHAIGAYVSTERQPLADGMALYAMSVIGAWLSTAVTNGDDVVAREQMMIGSLTAGISMKGGGAADHAFAHAVNALFGVHHGAAVARFLGPVMEYNLPTMPERFAAVAHALGVADPGGDVAAFGKAGIEAVGELVHRCPIPTLAEIGVSDEHVDPLVDKVMEDEFHLGLNPSAISAQDARRIIVRALADGERT